jgi:hypothetical protein
MTTESKIVDEALKEDGENAPTSEHNLSGEAHPESAPDAEHGSPSEQSKSKKKSKRSKLKKALGVKADDGDNERDCSTAEAANELGEDQPQGESSKAAGKLPAVETLERILQSKLPADAEAANQKPSREAQLAKKEISKMLTGLVRLTSFSGGQLDAQDTYANAR